MSDERPKVEPLALNKETLHELTEEEAAAAQGGATGTCARVTALRACGAVLSQVSDCVACNPKDPTQS